MHRVGVIQYLNSLPFIAPYLLHRLPSPVEWFRGTPKTLNEKILQKELSISFVSSIFYLQHQKELELIGDIGIGADGKVGSVSLFHPDDLYHLEGVSIALDPESKTSNALLRWYVERIRGERADYTFNKEQASAFLLIGDQNLHFGHPKGLKKVDLAEEWKNYTNLPLPFSVLVAQKGTAPEVKQEVKQLLVEGIEWSKSHPGELLTLAKHQSTLSDDHISAYWRQIHYHFDNRFNTALAHLERDVLKRIFK